MNKVYGPYLRKDGRKHVVHYDGETRRTQSYPRYLMEQHLGRELLEDETVDHINGDFTDDRIENFQLLSRAEHTRKDTKPAEIGTFDCEWCGDEFEMPMRQYRGNQVVKGKAGPYCSRSCAGKAHR